MKRRGSAGWKTFGKCGVCQKRRFATAETAHAELDRLQVLGRDATSVAVYLGPCGWWHTTSKEQEVAS